MKSIERRGKVLILAWLLVGCLAGPAFSLEMIRINTSIKPPFSTLAQDGFFDLLVKELFARIDIQVELIRLPAERALQMADDGYSDGEIPRIGGLSEQYPNLIAVSEPVIDYNFVAFVRKPAHERMSWQRLAGEDVGIIIGWKIYEERVPATAKITRVASPAQLLDLLSAGRIKFALYERYAGYHLLKEYHHNDMVECLPPLAVRPMFLYLHKKHAALIKPLATALRRMKEDGSWQRIAVQTLGSPTTK